ncbi:DNA-binding protein [Paraburkholderia hospita]|uniref:DNA-binding protein n=1 Tax=Paraburkholderia hospita TaxID=169430 RepID=UPI0003E7EB9D|nr:DNA-binding protein [Paraburkholderia hospita]EUC12671.1 KfrA domain-containing protein DNA-binding domain-containing protein [Burkholderia sp. BT03]SKC47351.1 replication region DNA-binding N-term [Paraburkholderia hospita]
MSGDLPAVSSDVPSDDARLAAEIGRLKAEFPNTRALYREVCALLFFRFGQTPTANRLYQLVRRGSMGTPAAVLGEFWTELRDKSRVRIEHPDLPADLGAAAGELVATLWTRASASAQAELDALRAEVEAQRAEAGQRVAAARGELARTETALEQRTAALLAAQVEVRELEKAQAEGQAARQALDAEVSRLKAEAAARDREIEKVREGFSRDLDKLRETAERAEERLRAAEKRALLEIDRERGAAVKLQKEADESTKRADRREADHRRVVDALQAQLGDARHQAGVLQGRLDAVQATNATLQQQLAAVRQAGAHEARPVRAKSATARPAATRTARTPGPARKIPVASTPSGKTAARRKKRGQA